MSGSPGFPHRRVAWTTARRAWLVGAISVSLAIAATAAGAAATRDGDRPVARIWEVTGAGASAEQARRLADTLGLDAALRGSDGSLRYVDADRFLAVPTVDVGEASRDEHGHATAARAIDPEALADTKVLADGKALRRARETLATAGLLPEGAKAAVGHARLTLYGASGRKQTSAALDTSVSFGLTLDRIRLGGPGARIRLTFGADGSVTQLRHAWRDLRPGPLVPITGADEARGQCAERYGPAADGARITVKLVYYAPPLSLANVQRIVPHYACGGTQRSGADLQQIMLPAVQDGPVVDLTVGTERDRTVVVGHAEVRGGRAPYSYSWGSSHSGIPAGHTAGPDISYQPEGINPSPERVQVGVTDADGLTAVSAAYADAVLQLSADTEPTDAPTVGTEWLFGLEEAYGFHQEATSSTTGVVGKFIKGASDARERDFKDPAFGGQDTFWADDVDLAFYKGHANGNGWEMETQQDDTFVRYTDGKWGNRDLEWLVIEACGPLRPLSDGKDVIERWGPTFAGLHILLGYATVSWVLPGQGEGFASLMLGKDDDPISIVDAWALTAIEIQFGDIEYAAMGPTIPKLVFTGPGQQQPKIVQQSNYDDFFWDRGSTGQDIPVPQGYWVLTAPVD